MNILFILGVILMGSYLIKCGISNRVIQEDDPIVIMFISKPILNGNKIHESDCFIDWRPERIMIPATQQDCGGVDIDIEYKSLVIKTMVMMYQHSAETDSDNDCHPSWKQYFIKNIQDSESLELMTWDDILQHFNKFVSIIHSNGIAYLNRTHNVTSIMKICNIDKHVVDCIKKAPALIDSYTLKYNNNANANYKFNTISNFDDYLKYVTISNFNRYKEFLTSRFGNLYKILSFNSAYNNYYELFHIESYDVKFHTIEEVINFAVYQRKEKHFIDYALILGVNFTPSIYASQDYSEYASLNNRNLMKIVFNKQQELYIKNNLDNKYENEEDFQGKPIPEEMTRTEYLNLYNSPEKIKELINSPEVLATEYNNLINSDLIGFDILPT